MEPAQTIIAICGGVAETARLAERSESRVRRWTYPPDRGGTGGLVPADCQVILLARARAEGIDLRPEHFFPDFAAGSPSEAA